MAARRRTPEEVAWLTENIPLMHVDKARDAFLERFGWVPSYQGWMVWAAKHKLRCKKDGPRPANQRCERKVFWCREPEMDAWMCEHDHGQHITDIIDDFEAEFGFRLTRTQVSANRAIHDRKPRRDMRGRRCSVPVGAERVKKGAVWVKVRDVPDKAGTKDNWMPKSRYVYEREVGPVPEGHQIVFADGDMRNFDVDNLVPVPFNLIGIINGNFGGWHDRESLELAIAHAKLATAIKDAEFRERRCAVCGDTFKPNREYKEPTRTCPKCLAAGKMAKPRQVKEYQGRVCAVCGEEFTANDSQQRRCRKCIDAMPKGNIAAQRNRYIKTGRR